MLPPTEALTALAAVATLAMVNALHPMPLVLPSDGPTALMAAHLMGLAMMAIGTLVASLGARELMAAGVSPLSSDATAAAPARPAKLVDTGPYGFTRNPMYLGQICAALGLSVRRCCCWFC